MDRAKKDRFYVVRGIGLLNIDEIVKCGGSTAKARVPPRETIGEVVNWNRRRRGWDSG